MPIRTETAQPSSPTTAAPRGASRMRSRSGWWGSMCPFLSPAPITPLVPGRIPFKETRTHTVPRACSSSPKGRLSPRGGSPPATQASTSASPGTTDVTTTQRPDLSSAADGTSDELAAAGARTLELDRAHVFHSWSAQALIRPMAIAGAQGSYVWDYDGHRYLDFSSQLVNTNIGHQHPRVVAAIKEQAGRLCTVAPQHANDKRGEAAQLVAGLAPDGMSKVFFPNSGAEAIEHASRMARLHTGRIKLLSAYRSYHGATSTAINLTGDSRRWPSDYGSAGVAHFFGPFLYRSPFHATSEREECERALAHLEDVVTFEGADTIAAIVLETIPGTAGIMPPPDGYLAGVRDICNRHGLVYIADEVMAGFGRTGAWWAFDNWTVAPDLITFAKGVTSGYVPLGGVVIADAIAADFETRAYPGGLTYSGHPLACATAVATIQTMRDEGIVENAARTGADA